MPALALPAAQAQPEAAAPGAPGLLLPALVLVSSVRLPDPTALPPIDDMSAGDMVRELVAVAVQREAETAAALEAVDRPAPASTLKSQLAEAEAAAAAAAAAVQGTLVHSRREWGSLASDAVAGGLAARAETPALLIDYALEEAGGIDRPFYQDPTRLALEVSLCAPATSTTSIPSASAPAPIQLRLSHSSALPARTLAYAVPRPSSAVTPGLPCVGPPPAKDAVRVLRELIAAPAPAAAMATAAALAAHSFTPALQAAAASAATTLLHSSCRVFPHSHLTPAQSEERVQCLVERIKALTGYDYTPPCAPTASAARLGSTHATRPYAAARQGSSSGQMGSPLRGSSSGRSSGLGAAATPLPGRGRLGGVERGSVTAGELHFAIAGEEEGGGSAGTGAGSAGAGSSLESSPAATDRRGGGGQLGSFPSLLSPVLSQAAPAGAFTPAPSVRRTISRYLSTCDLSRRSGASPAHFDREHHQGILTQMQVSVCGGV